MRSRRRHCAGRYAVRRPIDSVSAPGIILADIWNDTKIITIDQLGRDFLNAVQDGQKIDVSSDGTVTVYDD
jgi:uncharacterized protein